MAAHLDESTGFFQSHSALLTRIDQATEKLEQRIVAAPGPPKRPPLRRQSPARRFPSRRRSRRPPLPFRSPLQTSLEDVLTDFDQEIASIFTDEAVELIDAAQGALAQWNENRSSVDGLDALKRPLHTSRAARAWRVSCPWAI